MSSQQSASSRLTPSGLSAWHQVAASVALREAEGDAVNDFRKTHKTKRWADLPAESRDDVIQKYFERRIKDYSDQPDYSRELNLEASQAFYDSVPIDDLRQMHNFNMSRLMNRRTAGDPVTYNDSDVDYPMAPDYRYDKFRSSTLDFDGLSSGKGLPTQQSFDQTWRKVQMVMSLGSEDEARQVMQSPGCPSAYSHGLDDLWRRMHEPQSYKGGTIDPTEGLYDLSRRRKDSSGQHTFEKFRKKSALRKGGGREFDRGGLDPLPGFANGASSISQPGLVRGTSIFPNESSTPASSAPYVSPGVSAQPSVAVPSSFASTPVSSPFTPPARTSTPIPSPISPFASTPSLPLVSPVQAPAARGRFNSPWAPPQSTNALSTGIQGVPNPHSSFGQPSNPQPTQAHFPSQSQSYAASQGAMMTGPSPLLSRPTSVQSNFAQRPGSNPTGVLSPAGNSSVNNFTTLSGSAAASPSPAHSVFAQPSIPSTQPVTPRKSILKKTSSFDSATRSSLQGDSIRPAQTRFADTAASREFSQNDRPIDRGLERRESVLSKTENAPGTSGTASALSARAYGIPSVMRTGSCGPSSVGASPFSLRSTGLVR